MTLPKNWLQWFKTLVAAFVAGASTSFLSALGVTGAQAIGIKIDQFSGKQLLTMTVFGGLIGAANYLKQSPVPPSQP